MPLVANICNPGLPAASPRQQCLPRPKFSGLREQSPPPTRWKRPNLLARLINPIVIGITFFNGARMGLEKLGEMGPPDSTCAAIAKALEPSPLANDVMRLAVLESIIYFLMKRKRNIVSHELGHALVERHTAQKLGLHPRSEADHTAFEFSSLRKLLREGSLGEAYDYSKIRDKRVEEAINVIKAAKKNGMFYAPEFAPQRDILRQYFRDNLVSLPAGPMLEGYLQGRNILGGPMGDRWGMFCSAMALAELQRPFKEWGNFELWRFVHRSIREGQAEAKAFFDSLNPIFIRVLDQELSARAQRGQTRFSTHELEDLIDAIGQSAPFFREQHLEPDSPART